MLANDQLSKTREDFSTPIHASYIEAFKKKSADPNNELMVAEYGNKIVGIFADHLHSLFGPQEGLAASESLSDYRPLQIEGVSVKMRVREQ